MKTKNGLRFITLLIFLLLIMLFSSCSNGISVQNYTMSDDPLASEKLSPNEKEYASFCFGINSKVDHITYDGEAIVLKCYFENGAEDCDAGLMIFIGGVPQSYVIEGNEDNSVLHDLSLKKNTKTSFTIKFTPSIGKKGDQLYIYFVYMFNPNYLPTLDHPSFGANQGIGQLQPSLLFFKKTVTENYLKINSNYTMTNFQNNNLSNPTVQNDAVFNLYDQSENKNTNIIQCRGNFVTLKLEGFGETEATYLTTIFINNRPISLIDGNNYLSLRITDGKLSIQDANLNIKGLHGSYCLYSVSVPINTNSITSKLSIVKSPSKIIEIG